MIFARKMPEFYMKIAQIFFPKLWGARAPLSPSPTPMVVFRDITSLVVLSNKNKNEMEEEK